MAVDSIVQLYPEVPARAGEIDSDGGRLVDTPHGDNAHIRKSEHAETERESVVGVAPSPHLGQLGDRRGESRRVAELAGRKGPAVGSREPAQVANRAPSWQQQSGKLSKVELDSLTDLDDTMK